MKLRYKLAWYNLLTKLIFVMIFLLVMPYFLERVNIIQTDNELINKREQVIGLIGEFGVEGLMAGNLDQGIGSYNILKQEYISLEPAPSDSLWNFIEVAQRRVDNEIIDYRVLNYSFIVDGETYLLEIGTSLDSIYETERNIRNITLILLGLFVIISFVADTTLARVLTRPLELITHKLRETKSPALFDRTPVQTTTTDFAYLDLTLNELMQKIDDLFTREKEITANISHELLTPISVLQSRLENLISNGDLKEQSAEKVSESLRTLHRLKGIINSLLLIARVENHQFIKNDNFPLQELLTEVIEEIEPVANDKGLDILTRFDCEQHLSKANRSLLFTLLFNIINNAVKFSGDTPAGPVEIHCYVEGNNFKVRIRDHGPGIPPEQAADLFQRFKKRKSPDGHGLGLAIAKTIADFHGIVIRLDSPSGQGTAFTLDFPADL
ncbi:MAG: HAMP domain-containing sensor histidine kinase [Bacteroides sp.]|jgi:signal transduction histidine kinase|nr:HAMP domain-containing sensor histidine kinase [Bacteroides sp.]